MHFFRMWNVVKSLYFVFLLPMWLVPYILDMPLLVQFKMLLSDGKIIAVSHGKTMKNAYVKFI